MPRAVYLLLTEAHGKPTWNGVWMHCGSSIYFCGHFISVEPADLRSTRIALIKRYKEQRRDIGRACFGLSFFMAISFF